MASEGKINLTSNEIEAANRAEATALLIRRGYRVYRPEADCDGEDLVLRTPSGELLMTQLKSRPTVNFQRYGKSKELRMLFPNPKTREWFLVRHTDLYLWIEARHGHTPKWDKTWSYPSVSADLDRYLRPFKVA